jgi:hypothetical protein
MSACTSHDLCLEELPLNVSAPRGDLREDRVPSITGVVVTTDEMKPAESVSLRIHVDY